MKGGFWLWSEDEFYANTYKTGSNSSTEAVFVKQFPIRALLYRNPIPNLEIETIFMVLKMLVYITCSLQYNKFLK